MTRPEAIRITKIHLAAAICVLKTDPIKVVRVGTVHAFSLATYEFNREIQVARFKRDRGTFEEHLSDMLLNLERALGSDFPCPVGSEDEMVAAAQEIAKALQDLLLTN